MPQFWQATTTVVFCACILRAVTSIGEGASDGWSFCDCVNAVAGCLSCETVKFALFDTLLLKAGHPLQPSAPPVPLHRPPPGHEPTGV